MKLLDAIQQVKQPESKYSWAYSEDLDELSEALDLPPLYGSAWDAADLRLQSYPLFTWTCTDTGVGLRALYFDGKPVAATYQPYRKSDKEFKWVSKEAADKVREFLISLNPVQSPEIELIDPDEDIDMEAMFEIADKRGELEVGV